MPSVREGLASVLAFVREMAALPCFWNQPDCGACNGCRARAALDAWEKRGPLEEDDKTWQVVFAACARSGREDDPEPAFDAAHWGINALDEALFGPRVMPELTGPLDTPGAAPARFEHLAEALYDVPSRPSALPALSMLSLLDELDVTAGPELNGNPRAQGILDKLRDMARAAPPTSSVGPRKP